jgi:heme exporter protein A
VLEAVELECERSGRILFRGLSFALHPGELLRIAGANGSGKTSLLRILCGLLAPTQGEVRWQGMRVERLREEYSTRLVYLGHAPAVKDDLTAAENLSISTFLAGIRPGEEAVRAALARFGLSGKDVPVKKLSQGQRRRAALARLCLSASAPLWLLDEPFAALDVEGASLLGGLIKDHMARRGAVVFTTHQDPGIATTRVIDLG